MRLNVLKSIDDVVSAGLCCGCGACAYAQAETFEMCDVEHAGRRPLRIGDDLTFDDRPAMRICPGHHVPAPMNHTTCEIVRDSAWGNVIEVWEGHAADDAIRHRGSSGGVMTAIALHCLDRGMHGVLHVRAREDAPHLNETVLSRSRDEVLEGAGSRYAPASPCERLDLIENAPGECVFIGKPCDVAAVTQLRAARPRLDRNIGLTMAMFCGGTPSTAGTIEMLRLMGVDDVHDLASLRYRGHGWPGRATARTRSGGVERTMDYERAWGDILTKHKPWRCKVCADHIGELADIAVADAWHRDVDSHQPGLSLVVVRTKRGRDVLHEAMRAGAVVLRRASVQTLWQAQPNLAKARGQVWGRALALRMLRRAAPRFDGMATWPLWRQCLSPREKAASILGTIRRVLRGRADERPQKLTFHESATDANPSVALIGDFQGGACRKAA